jgi:hypothetical protein
VSGERTIVVRPFEWLPVWNPRSVRTTV